MTDPPGKSLIRQAARFGVRDIQGKVRAAIEKNIPKLGGVVSDVDAAPPVVPTDSSLPPHYLCLRCNDLILPGPDLETWNIRLGTADDLINGFLEKNCQLCEVLIRRLLTVVNHPRYEEYWKFDVSLSKTTTESKSKWSRRATKESKVELVYTPRRDLYTIESLVATEDQWDMDIEYGEMKIDTKWDVEYARKSLASCDSSHQCRHRGAQDRTLPTRLLDLGVGNEETIKLILTGDGRGIGDKRYVALSYCWGSSPPFVTKPSTLSSRMSGIQVADMPATLRETVQGGLIDGKPWCRIPHYQAGTNGSVAHDDAVILAPAYKESYNADRGSEFYKEPLASRAWTYQEWVLSPRLLVFMAAAPLRFVCDQQNPLNLSPNAARLVEIDPMWPKMAGSAEDVWPSVVRNFTSRRITAPSDKLPALAGIANRFSDGSRGDYFAGLWRTTLLRDLLWYVPSPTYQVGQSSSSAYGFMMQNTRRVVLDGKPRAPSWSWVAIDGAIIMQDESGWETVAMVTQCCIELANPTDKFGEVGAGLLEISCPFLLVDHFGMKLDKRYLTEGDEQRHIRFWIDDEAEWKELIGRELPGCKYGNGSHIWNIAPGDFSLYLRTGWVGTLFYQLSLAMSKVSILLLYIRLFQFNWASRVAWVILAIVVAYNVGGFISAMTLCRPLEAFWDSTIEGECKSASYTWAVIGLHVATDFLIFLLPIPVVWLMTSLSWREKIGVMLIFAIGFFVCIISILRIIWIKEALANDSQDPLYDYATLSYWNCVEVNSAIIIPCLVVMRPLFRKILKSSAAHSHEPLDGLEDQESLELAPPVQARRRIGSLVRSRSSERTDDAMETGGTDVRLPDAVDEPKAPPNAFRGFRFDK
ncbi:hypothetical protein OQA88_782 [Cercophora sp. LCS_1]